MAKKRSFLDSIALLLGSLTGKRSEIETGLAAKETEEGDSLFNDLIAPVSNLLKDYTKSGMTDQAKEEIDYSAGVQYDLWNKTQSLPAQMAQAKEAGINPFAVFGNGGAVGSVPSSASPSAGSSDLISMLLNFALQKKRLDLDADLLPHKAALMDAQSNLAGSRANEINTLLPERVENLRENTNLLIERAVSEQYQQDLLAAGVTQKEAEAALLIRQEAILSIDEKNRQRFLDLDMDLKAAQARMARAAAAKDYEEILRINQETANLKIEHDNLLKEGVGITLNNGKLAHEFNILSKEDANSETRIKQENAGRVVGMVCDGINTVVGVVGATSGVANATAALKTAAASQSRALTYDRNSFYEESEEMYNSKGELKYSKRRTHR